MPVAAVVIQFPDAVESIEILHDHAGDSARVAGVNEHPFAG
jgi:hypothetical protein